MLSFYYFIICPIELYEQENQRGDLSTPSGLGEELQELLQLQVCGARTNKVYPGRVSYHSVEYLSHHSSVPRA